MTRVPQCGADRGIGKNKARIFELLQIHIYEQTECNELKHHYLKPDILIAFGIDSLLPCIITFKVFLWQLSVVMLCLVEKWCVCVGGYGRECAFVLCMCVV